MRDKQQAPSESKRKQVVPVMVGRVPRKATRHSGTERCQEARWSVPQTRSKNVKFDPHLRRARGSRQIPIDETLFSRLRPISTSLLTQKLGYRALAASSRNSSLRASPKVANDGNSCREALKTSRKRSRLHQAAALTPLFRVRMCYCRFQEIGNAV